MPQWTPLSANDDNFASNRLCTFLPGHDAPDVRDASRHPKIFYSLQKFEAPSPLVSVDVSMRKIAALPKLADTKKKDARLTIRIPRELKARIEGIDRVYGVALPKIANECLKAFCDYVEQKKQTPAFPLSIGPYSPGPKAPVHGSLRRHRGFRDGHPQRT
jgi:hypothetical protein